MKLIDHIKEPAFIVLGYDRKDEEEIFTCKKALRKACARRGAAYQLIYLLLIFEGCNLHDKSASKAYEEAFFGYQHHQDSGVSIEEKAGFLKKFLIKTLRLNSFDSVLAEKGNNVLVLSWFFCYMEIYFQRGVKFKRNFFMTKLGWGGFEPKSALERLSNGASNRDLIRDLAQMRSSYVFQSRLRFKTDVLSALEKLPSNVTV